MSSTPDSGPDPGGFSALVGNVLTLAAALLIAALALEGYVRLVADDGMQFDLEMWKYAQALKRPAVDPLAGHEHIPQSSAHLMGVDVAINGFGYRDDLQTLDKPGDVRRVLMLGDSLTFGWGVAQEDTPSELLQALLNQANDGWRYEVVNMGIGNANTDMQVRAMDLAGWQFDPDVIVLNYFINDAEPTPERAGGLLSEFSYAYVYFGGRLDTLRRQAGNVPDWRAYYSGLYRDNAKGWQTAVEAMRRLSSEAEGRDVPLVIANYPELHALAPYPFDGINQALATVVMDLRRDFVDLTPAVAGEIPENLWVHPQDAHPNAVANGKFAAALAPVIMGHFEN